jgi:hypothetical protein
MQCADEWAAKNARFFPKGVTAVKLAAAVE